MNTPTSDADDESLSSRRTCTRNRIVVVVFLLIAIAVAVILAVVLPSGNAAEDTTNSGSSSNAVGDTNDNTKNVDPTMAPSPAPSIKVTEAVTTNIPTTMTSTKVEEMILVSDLTMTLTPFDQVLEDPSISILWSSFTNLFIRNQLLSTMMSSNTDSLQIETTIVNQYLLTQQLRQSPSSSLVIEFNVEITTSISQQQQQQSDWAQAVDKALHDPGETYAIQLRSASPMFSQVSDVSVEDAMIIDPPPSTPSPSSSPVVTPPPTRPRTTAPLAPPTPVPVTLPPTNSPITPEPTGSPTESPTTPEPTAAPTQANPPATRSPITSGSGPTRLPTKTPSNPPTRSPTTSSPTKSSTPEPTDLPTKFPTEAPTLSPTTLSPTSSPSPDPTPSPTGFPTKFPSKTPTPPPITASPTRSPTLDPTPTPTRFPTLRPSKSPTSSPTKSPTRQPTTPPPTDRPTLRPSNTPTRRPTTPSPITPSPIIPATPQPTAEPLTIFGSFELLETVPHDAGSFTQGLELIPGNPDQYFESSGLYGQSTVRIVDVASGSVLQQRGLSRQYFGEGLTYFDGKLIQITWKEQTAFIYDATTLDVLEVLDSYTTTNGEGWGICFVESENIFHVSDGTHYLHRWDASTKDFLDKVAVQSRVLNSSNGVITTRNVNNINELEWDRHRETVLANVWFQDYLIRINPTTGLVTHRYDLSSLYRPSSANVLNGIAITDTPDEIWVTGKQWPNMYRIRLID